jgi:TPR repeat protein
MLRSGQSVVVNWYLDRAIVGDAEAALRLGKIYEHGWGAISDKKEASKWYQKAIHLGSKEANKLLQQLTVRLTQEGEGLSEKDNGFITHSALPSNWIAYLLAIFVAAFIFFSPMLLRKQKERSELPLLEESVRHREEPPFSNS